MKSKEKNRYNEDTNALLRSRESRLYITAIYHGMGVKEEMNLFRILDRGIDDMEAGHELPLDEAFRKVSELRDS